MKISELRKEFLDYFSARDHKIMASSSLLPAGDPTLLFTSAGMVPFKSYFSAEEVPPHPRLASVQKCMRTTDLEAVGKTLRHLSFFEMLGNFSFGNYFKKEAIEFAWEFSREKLNFPAEDIWISIYNDDDEAYELWNKHIGVPASKIVRLGKEDNFWGPAGDKGACGPCSELYLDRGPRFGEGPENQGPGGSGERFLEFWNLVFNQFNFDGQTFQPLQQTGIDTGAGLERLATLLQNVESVYDTDELSLLGSRVANAFKISDNDPETITTIRVLTDHIRTLTFSIADGIYPSNESRGYVLRRVLRRALLFGRRLGQSEPTLFKLVGDVADIYGDFYPEIKGSVKLSQGFIQGEEERFLKTLEEGLGRLEDLIEKAETNQKPVSGQEVFVLHDTYGFPLELTEEIVQGKNLEIEMSGYVSAMEAQKERGRAAFRTNLNDFDTGSLSSAFTGYDELTTQAKIIAIYKGKTSVESIEESGTSGESIFFAADRSPFYPEGGGQLGDIGVVKFPNGQAKVIDTQKSGEVILHQVSKLEGSMAVHDDIVLEVSFQNRQQLMQHHSATHLLNGALRRVMGDHIRQSGSLVDADYLRFDFTSPKALTLDELDRVQIDVNQNIQKKFEISTEVLPKAEAEKRGAVMTFGEKYGETVRVVAMGDASVEFCGGTHMSNTSLLDVFLLLKESSPGAGNRRIEAKCGVAAKTHFQRQIASLSEQVQSAAKFFTDDKDSAYIELKQEIDSLVNLPVTQENWKKVLVNQGKLNKLESDHKKKQKKKGSSFQIPAETLEQIISSSTSKIKLKVFEELNIQDLKHAADALRSRKADSFYLLLSYANAHFFFVCATSREICQQNNISLNEIFKGLQGSLTLDAAGGGKPELIQGSSREKCSQEQVLEFAEDFKVKLEQQLNNLQ